MDRCNSLRRTQTLVHHLSLNPVRAQVVVPATPTIPFSSDNSGLEVQVNLTDRDIRLLNSMPGPCRDSARYPGGVEQVLREYQRASSLGENHVKIAEWQRQYGSDGMGSNIVIPKVLFMKSEVEPGKWKLEPPQLVLDVIVANPHDAARIAKINLQKQPNFTPAMYGSIISTTDNTKWRAQREHFVTGFLPQGSLDKIFPVSLERAKHCADRLGSLAEASNGSVVDMSEFYLHETKAQLQLALFGQDDEFVDNTNKNFRDALAGKFDRKYPSKYLRELVERTHDSQLKGATTSQSGCPVHGPLAERMGSAALSDRDQLGNAFIFAFAGHDTTGHTMTWLTYEMARNPDLQRRLQAEVDGWFEMIKSLQRPIQYGDLKHLPFLTRCFMETLRLWPAVADGTYRELQMDEAITGADGREVVLPKGTYVRIPNWPRHRNPDLWGPDVNEFNPDRDFEGDEIWNGDVLRAYNPATERFSPFTFAPRDCIGKNFAHMESRLILAHCFRQFSFELTDEYKNMDKAKFNGVNYGTMGPQDLSQPNVVRAIPGWGPSKRRPLGMPVRAVRRRQGV